MTPLTFRKEFVMNESFDLNDELELEGEQEPATENKVDPAETDPSATTEIVGIRFKKSGKTYYFAPNGFVLNQDDRVIVDTSRGQEYGFTAVTNREIKNSEISEPLRGVIRMATPEDTRIHEENVKKEIDAFNACIVLIDKHRLEMKLIDAELSFDRSKLLFYFSAEGRIDFRELVKDLASAFHTRIEMRQIGIRDEAKILGGLGICGRPYCCNTFLSDFGQVSVKMAKEQNLSLNSAKISGSCGRLMCCLRFEYDTYLKEKSLTPKVDARVVTPNGAGVVVAANPLAGIVKVKLDCAGEDADAVVFVREDVVEESKYDGKPLTKTEIPDRKHKKYELPTISEFSATAPVTAPTPAPAEPVQSDPVQSEPAKDQPKELKEPKEGAEESREQPRHRHKHKKHHKGNGNQNQQKAPENQPKNENKGADRPDAQRNNNQPKHRPEGKPQNQNQPKPKPENQGAQNVPGAEGDAQKKNKKWKKPYYRHHNKNKKPQSGEGKQG